MCGGVNTSSPRRSSEGGEGARLSRWGIPQPRRVSRIQTVGYWPRSFICQRRLKGRRVIFFVFTVIFIGRKTQGPIAWHACEGVCFLPSKFTPCVQAEGKRITGPVGPKEKSKWVQAR
jgi:hypothetical protein